MMHANHPQTGYLHFNLPAGANTHQITQRRTFLRGASWFPSGGATADIYDNASANSNQKGRLEGIVLSDGVIYDMEMKTGLRVVTDASWLGGSIYFK